MLHYLYSNYLWIMNRHQSKPFSKLELSVSLHPRSSSSIDDTMIDVERKQQLQLNPGPNLLARFDGKHIRDDNGICRSIRKRSFSSWLLPFHHMLHMLDTSLSFNIINKRKEYFLVILLLYNLTK